MNILLTGGAGYIGSTTANLFLDKGHNVVVIDDLSTGSIRNLPSKVKFFKFNIKNKIKLQKLLEEYEFDILIHFAAFIDVEESVKKPKKYYDNNFKNTKILLEICSKYNLNKIIFSSTAAVYGNSITGIVSENTPVNPKSPYAKSKLKCENLIKKNNFDFIILRYFNVSGAETKLRCGHISKKKSTHLIKKICENFYKDEDLEIFGKNYPSKDGTAIRDYIHVSDLAMAHYKSAKYLLKFKKSHVLNCGYGKGNSVLNVIKTFNKINYKKIKYTFSNRRLGDVFKIVTKTNKIKRILRWKPKYQSLRYILQSSLKWEKKISIKNAK